MQTGKESPEQKAARLTARATVFIAFFTLATIAVGASQFIVFYRQWTIMKRQLMEMKTASKIAEETLVGTQRPWISVKATIGPRGLFFDANGANLDLIFALKNTGPTPAVTVRVEGAPRIDVRTNDRMTELGKVSDDAKKQPPDPKMVGYTIFPGDTLPLDITYPFANKELLDTIVRKQHGFIFPVVIGCVDYFFTFSEPAHHQSRFVYELDCLTPSGSVRPIQITDGDKACNTLRLTPWLEAGSFQAN